MRRSLLSCLALPLLVVALVVCVGCGEDASAVEARNARAEFERVAANVKQLRQGFVPSDKGLAALGKYKSTSINFDTDAMKAARKENKLPMYQAELMRQAEDDLKKLINKGQTTQKVAAHKLLAELYVASAAHERRAAMEASDEHAEPSASIETFLAGIERAGSLIGRFANDDKPSVDNWTASQTKVGEAVAAAKAEADRLSARIADLEGQIATATKAREDAFKNAASFREKAFPLKGQEQYDLHMKAIDADKAGYAANKSIEELTKKGELTEEGKLVEGKESLELAKAKLVIVKREQAVVDSWLATLAGGITDAGGRKSRLAKIEDDVKKERDAAIKQLEEDFKKMSDTHTAAVDAKLDGAIKKIDEALDLLKKAETMAPGDMKASVKLDQLTALMAKLQAQSEAVVAANRFAIVANQVKLRASQAMPQSVAALDATLKTMEERLTALGSGVIATAGAITTLARDQALAGTPKEGDALGEARSAQVRAARNLAESAPPRINVHRFDGKTTGPTTPTGPESTTPPAPAPAPLPAPVPAPAPAP